MSNSIATNPAVIEMTSVILNAQDHSIGKWNRRRLGLILNFYILADLPPTILTKMFKDLRGSVLIRLTTVCKKFNSAIGDSKPLMNKIRLRVRRCESEDLKELDKILLKTKRRYEHITINNIQRDYDSCVSFIQKRNTWSSLKLSTCNFETLPNQISFLSMFSNLSEIEFDNHVDSYYVRRGDPVLSVTIPSLQKLKVGTLNIDFICTGLTSLELTGTHDSCATTLLVRNPNLEELHLSYESFEAIFAQNFLELNINLRIKRFFLKRLNSSEYISQNSIRNFESFFMSQSDNIEELTLDWFSGIPPRVRPGSSEHRSFRVRRNHRDDELLCIEEIPPFERRSFDRNEDACLRTLAIAFSHFRKLNKLVVGDKHAFLTNVQVPSVGALQIEPNHNITELRLRFEKTSHSDALLKKFISACPSVTSLFAHAMDQHLLEFCAAELPNLETLFALSLKVDSLPNESTKFEKLQRLNFCECFIENKPEIRQLKLFDKKNLVLSYLSGKSEQH